MIIRFSSIGDIVLTSAVVRCLKEQLQDAEIHYLTKKQYAPLLIANPHIDRIWTYDRNFSEIIPQMKSQGFEFIADLHRNYRSSFVKFRLGIKSAAFPKLNARKWLAVKFKAGVLPDLHVVDRYFRAVSPLGVKNDGQGLSYFIPAGDEVDLSGLPPAHRNGFVAIVIGGKHKTKIFPPSRVAEVCKRVFRPVILLGGQEDAERGEQIVQMSGPGVFNACGLFNINQSASLISQADSVMTNDTGLMHVAAAFHRPVVSVWGNTIPAFGMYPYLPGKFKDRSLVAEVSGLSCRPCSKLGYDSCPKNHFKCMTEIDIDPVVTFLNELHD